MAPLAGASHPEVAHALLLLMREVPVFHQERRLVTAIGFTGTTRGMNALQRKVFEELVSPHGLHRAEFHHGCAPGADYQAAIIAREWGLYVVGHPGKSKRGELLSNLTMANNETREPEDFLKRNQVIVRESERLMAAPRTYIEEQRSGTWATIRYARKLKRPIQIIWPDGTVKEENA